MSVTTWKLVRDPETGQTNTVWRKWDDGREESMFISTLEFQEWLAEGNEPLPADEFQL
jgi:hypothetical protein